VNTAKSYPRGLNPICQYGHFRTGAITSNLAHGSVLGAGLIRQRCKIVTLLCAFICVGQFLFAVDLVWTNIAGGAWNTAANWWPNQVPTTNDHVWITNGGTYTVTISGNAAAGELTLGGTTGTQTVSVTGGTFLIGNGTGNTNAVLRITGGTLGGTGKLILAGPLKLERWLNYECRCAVRRWYDQWQCDKNTSIRVLGKHRCAQIQWWIP